MSGCGVRALDLICMGRTSVDLYGEQEGARLEDTNSFRKYVGGSATNVAVGTARLGVDSAMLTRVGDEQMGRFVRNTLAENGVDVSRVSADPERLTPYVLLAVRELEDFPRIFVYEDSADMAVDEDDVDADFVASSKALLITGTHLSRRNTREAIAKAVRYARENGVRVVFDLDYRPVFWGVASHEKGGEMYVESREVTEIYRSVLPDCDLIVGTEEEIHIVGGTTNSHEALRSIRNLTDATLVLKTGAMGATVFDGEVPDSLEEGVRVPGFPVVVVNSVGAGDAFLSGFLSGWLYDEPFKQCLTLGNACGALVVSRHGCSPAMPTREELDYYLPRAGELRHLDKDEWLAHLHRVTTRRRPDELNVFAVDHRWQLEEMVDEIGVDREKIYALKSLLGHAFQRVADGEADVGLLLDGVYGAGALAEQAGSGIWIARAVEIAGSRPVELIGGYNVGAVLRRWPAGQVVKCNIYCHPDDEEEIRRTQEQRLAVLFEACALEERELLVEIQSPKGMDYDSGSVPALLKRFYSLGIRPDWWKVPLNEDAAFWQKVGDVVRDYDPHCSGVLLLGGGAGEEAITRGFAAASQEPVCNGFAVGRSIYAEPARRWFKNECTDQQFMEAVAANYLSMIRLWRNQSAA